MSIGTTDIFLTVIIVSTLVVGFFWGAVRSLMLLAAWVIAFLAGAYLKLDLGSYLGREWPNFSPAWSEMAAFMIIFIGLLLAIPVLIIVTTKANQRVTRFQVLDDAVGALFAVFVAVLGIAGLMIVLSTYYEPATFVDPEGGPEWSARLYQSLLSSNIGRGVDQQVVPLIEFVLRPILPSDVLEAMA